MFVALQVDHIASLLCCWCYGFISLLVLWVCCIAYGVVGVKGLSHCLWRYWCCGFVTLLVLLLVCHIASVVVSLSHHWSITFLPSTSLNPRPCVVIVVPLHYWLLFLLHVFW